MRITVVSGEVRAPERENISQFMSLEGLREGARGEVRN